MENLKVTVIQPDIIWENPVENLRKYDTMLSETNSTDVILLPEMFSTGFSMDTGKLAEEMDGKTLNWMKKLASEKSASVAGSLIVKENGKFFNRLVWVFPNGNFSHYDKRHMFTMGEEHLSYTPGNEKLILEYRGWRFCPLICYDLRFPVWSRNTENYDVLIYVANWPSPRSFVWNNLLVSRALENQCYCIGVNRTGTDGKGIKYAGNSAFISPKGETETLDDKESVKTFHLEFSELHNFRKSFPVLRDGDSFSII